MSDIASLFLDSTIAIMSVVLAVLFWVKGNKQFKMFFVALSLLITILAVSYVLELLSATLSEKLFWNGLEYLGIVGIPELYLLIVVRYAGRDDLLTRTNIIMVSVVPAFCLVTLWTNDLHHLFFESVTLEPGILQPFQAVDGIFSLLQIAYSYVLELAAISIAAIAVIKSHKVQRVQVGLILFSSLVPTLLVTLSLENLLPFPIIDVMLFGFILAGCVLYLVVYRYGLFYATPLALNSIADIMQDGAIMVNQEGLITYLNASAERLVHREKGFPLGKPLSSILPAVNAATVPDEEGSAIIEMIGPEGRTLRLEVRYSPVMVEKKKVSQLLILRDITSQRKVEEALASSNSKLNVLYGVTRHDILNRITVIRGYGQLLNDKTEENSQASEYLRKMMDSTVAIEHLINFTRDYEKVGIVSPEWQNVSKVYHKAKVLCAEQGVEYIVDTGSLEIFADPMLERFFYIMLDNTNRHGSKVTKVRLSSITSLDGGCTIVYEDDGTGVRPEDKSRIFLKGFGKDSGLGLYLGMQILAITGIEIRENGEYHKGVRFEIKVPAGKWRLAGQDQRA
ncbi:MAG TPA: histidine kinase N-terminal 7TM domain-containing protein [Methanomassiliicoccales archaeon]|jgi:signal transduction histidine kinase